MNNHFYDMFMLGTFLDLLNKNMIFKGIEKKFNEMSYYKWIFDRMSHSIKCQFDEKSIRRNVHSMKRRAPE